MFEIPEKSGEEDFLKSFQATISVNIASLLSSRGLWGEVFKVHLHHSQNPFQYISNELDIGCSVQ